VIFGHNLTIDLTLTC